ncbi:MAG: hypothetical protein IJD63_02955 [Oscillospiraceae bacterium]|nr:hypothetical protein [Oscillospiraceae bacterium]
MKKRIALLLCLAMLAGMLAGCDVSIDSILSMFSKPETTKTETGLAAVRKAEKGTFVIAEGVVARITYALGQKPAGFILVDDTASIYVYDSELAAQVKEGNKITIQAEKDYWILESEQANAEKFGYIGCNQLKNPILISNDEGSHAFDTSWMETTTVKEIVDTPVTTDISSKVFKVTAQVKRVDGNGFVNYYINDLDGKTGSYIYTQCNGSDFAWLDEFDGKICTVNLTALNAKSSASGCVWRFLPVAVVDEGFDVNTVNFAENAVKLYGIPQFLRVYTGNPAMGLITSVDNELLGYTGAVLSYTSSDSAVISIDGNVMNCLASGTVQITVTATHNGVTYSEDVTIEVKMDQAEVQYSTVDDAIKTALNEKVTVKGIVGPSIVAPEKTGFYLIDETGVIVVLTDADTMTALEIGYEVIIEGNRDRLHDNTGSHAGQTCISGAAVKANNYGSHEYPTTSFDGALSVEDFYNLDKTVDFTTSVFLVTGYVVVEEAAYYTNIYISNSSTYSKSNINVRLYCSNAKQYDWLKAYVGQEVTVEMSPTNYNNKNYYTGCVLAVVHADGTKTVNTLNFN